ncbi:GNAT family N-acetyltransferase [Streptomyces sp. R302]|uniref:GNAT family N-acetyltransferase n=1 Tax=unclassified Streptomyces TaxID=2593676 RepID=UPI00145FCD25|nr:MULTISPECIES: GNAT family protein [unclassified Streptomyces]NML51751.1 GNAT family N-acetyltransferase [Streptomyces sp. R301]NML81371.1 GNAT family N-acetyltransferase [Streptomyces sp. R302]
MRKPFVVPRIAAGDGLVLRPWRLGDLPLVREAAEDSYIPLVTTVPSPYTHAEGVAFIARQEDRALSRAGYPFVMAEEAGDRGLGQIGLWPDATDEGRASVGYWVAGSARGRGIATVGLRAIASWALRDLALARLELYVEPWNTASRRTAEQAGFIYEGHLRSRQSVNGERRDMLIYSRITADLTDADG